MVKTSNLGGGVGSNNKKKRGYRRPTNIVTDKNFNRISSPVFFIDPPSTSKLLTPKGNMPIRSRLETEHPLKNPNAVATPNTIPPQIVPYIPKDDPMQNIVRVTQQMSVSLPVVLWRPSFSTISDSIVSASSPSPAAIDVLSNPQQMPPSPAQVSNPDAPIISTHKANNITFSTASISGRMASAFHSTASITSSTQIGVGKLDHYDVNTKITTVPLETVLNQTLNLEDVMDTMLDSVQFVKILVTIDDVVTIGDGYMPTDGLLQIVLGELLNLSDSLVQPIDGVSVLTRIAVNITLNLSDNMFFMLDGIVEFIVQITTITQTLGDTLNNWLDGILIAEIAVESLNLADTTGIATAEIIGSANVPMPTNLASIPSDWLGPIDVFVLDPLNPYIFAGTAIITTNKK